MRTILHVGCGVDPLPDYLQGYEETRLDINEAVSPHILASMLDMGAIGPFDAVFCQHAIEHVYPHEVDVVLREFLRVLKPGGHAMVFVPDLEGVRPTADVLFNAPAGPITGLDLIYGHGASLPTNEYMAHKTGFVRETLEAALEKAGFSKFKATRLGEYNLMGVGVK